MKDYSKYLVYYPNEKVKAIRDYRLDTGAGLKEAKEVIDRVFAYYEETGKTRQPEIIAENSDKKTSKKQEKSQEVLKGVAKGVGVAAGATAYVGVGTIFKLMKKYMK